MPSATNTITVNRPPDAVFAFLADGTTGPQWRPGILDIAHQGGSGVGARYRQGVKGPGGRRVAADYKITAWESGRRLAFIATAGPIRPIGEYRLEAVSEGTRVTFSLSVDLSGIKKLLMGGAVQSTMDAEVRSLSKLKQVLEAG
ncbi:MAG: SRPBCC family protein [Chloroflexi bacterium]|nr:SRPBCC family protein [Chloroflexota bacterium]